MTVDIRVGDCLDVLRTLDAESVQCVVTSPPYFGLRDYGVAGQIGLESSPDAFVAKMVAVFAEVRRVLKDDGTLWLNLGDSYSAHPGQRKTTDKPGPKQATSVGSLGAPSRSVEGMKAKDLIGIPWMVAFALRADGWYLRQCNIWAKPNGMPESVTDRPTSSHEYVFLLAKSARYFYDIDAARTPPSPATETRLAQNVDGQEGSERANGGERSDRPMKAVQRGDKQRGHVRVHAGFNARWDQMEREQQMAGGSNLRSVWWLAPAQFAEAHFATMPAPLAEICITAGSRIGDTILDPFGGAGTTGLVADRISRNALLIELNPAYADLARARITNDNPLFNPVVA